MCKEVLVQAKTMLLISLVTLVMTTTMKMMLMMIMTQVRSFDY